jgi:LCP family protein required for cell wall assembly
MELDMAGAEETPKKKQRSKIRTLAKGFGIAFSAVAICGLLVGGFIFGKGWLAAHKIFKGGGSSSTLFSTDIKPEKLKGEGDGRINILLLGAGGGDHDGADLTDSIVIASVDPVAKDIALLSIPRDLWVKVPNYWSMKINAAYASAKNEKLDNGGTEQQAQDEGFATLEAVVSEYMGIPIHYHALVNFQAFQQGVDAIGGVDVNVPKDLSDWFLMGYTNPIIARKGQQHFDGKTALLYAQSRHTTSDFDRGERQRLLLIALKEKILTVGTFSNPKTVSKLIDALGNNVTVNMTLGEMMRLYDITKDIPSTSIATVGLTDEANPLVTTGMINEQSIVQPRAGLTDFSEIQSFVRNTLRDPFLKSEDATIAILNGTAISGLATKKANELKSYGYNVTIIDDAPTKDHTQTIMYDKTAGVKKFTRNYLEKRLSITTSKEATPADILAQADFVVVLGTDANTPSSN